MNLLVLFSMFFIISQGQVQYRYKPPTFKYDIRINKMIPNQNRYLTLEPGTEIIYQDPLHSGRSSLFPKVEMFFIQF